MDNQAAAIPAGTCYDGSMKDQKPLEPLIPLNKLKSVVTGLIAVPKADVEKAEADRVKRPSPKPNRK